MEASIPIYIRFGELPKEGKSKIYFRDEVVGIEPEISVWEALKVDNAYPKLPENYNENTLSDYFYELLESKEKVYLVIGDRIRINGKDNEPLLENVKIIKEITQYYPNREVGE
mgnify:CR=1 FL=1